MVSDVKEVFRKGGQPLLAFLEYCVRSVRMDPVFVFLVREYRDLPTVSKALALYEVFCAPEALAKISLRRDLRIRTAVQPLLDRRTQERESAALPDAVPLPPLLPPKHLFDLVVQQLEESPGNTLRTVCECYDATRSPLENLPGGKMTEGQRAFVEKLWEPILRPQLVTAGFRRIANIA
jgi:hypothetical protein